MEIICETKRKVGTQYRKFYSVSCYCNNIFLCRADDFTRGRVKSCGCLKNIGKKEISESGELIFGSKHKLYPVHSMMKQRCYNKNHKQFKDWGGRGITVCDEWKNSYKIFYSWCMQNGYKNGLQIDRINNDGNYEPNNCRFVSPIENMRNRRKNYAPE